MYIYNGVRLKVYESFTGSFNNCLFPRRQICVGQVRLQKHGSMKTQKEDNDNALTHSFFLDRALGDPFLFQKGTLWRPQFFRLSKKLLFPINSLSVIYINILICYIYIYIFVFLNENSFFLLIFAFGLTPLIPETPLLAVEGF